MADSDDAWKALLQTNDWIKVADTKAAAVLAASGVIGGVLVRSLPKRDAWQHAPWQVGLTFLSLTLAVASAYVALRIFAPRLRTGEPRSLIYFDHIARRYPKSADFKQNFLAMLDREGQLRESIAEQLWANSRVARRKFRRVALSIWLLGGAMLTGLAVGILEGLSQ